MVRDNGEILLAAAAAGNRRMAATIDRNSNSRQLINGGSSLKLQLNLLSLLSLKTQLPNFAVSSFISFSAEVGCSFDRSACRTSISSS
jgi:hypothetical protein